MTTDLLDLLVGRFTTSDELYSAGLGLCLALVAAYVLHELRK